MRKSLRLRVKKGLIYRYGTLYDAAKKLNISYFRLGRILNGRIQPTPQEVEFLQSKVPNIGGSND